MVPVDHCRLTGPLPGLEEYAGFGGLFAPDAIESEEGAILVAPEQLALPLEPEAVKVGQ